MVRSMWLPVTSGVASLCVGVALWPQLATTADGLTVSAVLFGASADATLIKNPLDALFQRLPLVGRNGASLWSSPSEQSLQDLRVGNLSVHRIRYERGGHGAGDDKHENAERNLDESATTKDQEDETLIKSVFGSAWAAAARKARAQPISSVVVSWEDHRWAAEARPADQTLCAVGEDDAAVGENTSECQTKTESPTSEQSSQTSAREVLYEVQLWVNGWGFDAFWHPANRKISTSDPFVVLNDLPQEQELGFRVRMKVKTKTGLLSGFFATEVEGPWSDVVTLSPSKEHAIEAIIAFFVANKFFGAVLVSCIGLSVLVILRLVFSYVVYGKSSRSNAPALVTGSSSLDMDMDMPEPRRHRRRAHTTGRYNDNVDLQHEVADLRQELADSEAEVRRLMLFRGYGIEDLSEKELDDLEKELRHSIKLVQKRRRGMFQGSSAFESLDETEEEEDDVEDGVEDGVAGAMPALSRNGMLGTVFEEER